MVLNTPRVCQHYTTNLGPIGPLSNIRPTLHPSTCPGKCTCTRKVAAFQSSKVHSKTHTVCPILIINIGPIGPLFSTRLSPLIEPLPKGKSYMLWMIKKSYFTRKMATFLSRTVHSKTYRVSPSTQEILDPSVHYSVLNHIESRPCPTGRFDMSWLFQRATVPGKWLRPNHIRYIPRPTGSILSTQEILDPSVHYPVLDHHIESLRPNHVRYGTF